MDSTTARFDRLPISSLKPNPANPKNHDVEAIARSIESFGFQGAIIVEAGSLQVVAGHGRLKALKLLEKRGGDPPRGVLNGGAGWLAPCVVTAFDNAAEAAAYLLADNRVGELGGWDEEALLHLLRDLQGEEALLEAAGFDEDYIGLLEANVDLQQAKITASNLPIEESLERYEKSQTRSITLLMTIEEHKALISRLDQVREMNDGEWSNYDVINHVLEVYCGDQAL